MPPPRTHAHPCQAEGHLKRQAMRDNFVQKNAQLILMYDEILKIIPDPAESMSKHTWEFRMRHARTVVRHVEDCDDTGNRSGLFNYILDAHKNAMAEHVEYRWMLPDPADEITNSMWLKQALNVLVALPPIWGSRGSRDEQQKGVMFTRHFSF